ncbi:MAG: acyloxyacyl hydrolase [Bacteroidetes bacterium]|nr:acyloxyacyl hydrolase [Bacteroidota bacterium]
MYCTASFAQDTAKYAGYGIEVNPIAGHIIKHNLIFPPMPSMSTALDINILKQTTGKKAWQQRRHYPVVGLGITYTDYGLDSVYGKCIGVYPVYQFNIIKGKKIEWTWRFGIGVGYVTKHYERYPTWDTINNLIGSNMNNFTMMASDVRYHINKHWDIQLGLSATHISNGDLKRPNLGVNLAGGHIGVRYFPVSSKPALIKQELPTLKNRWLIHLRYGMGFVEYGIGDGPHYPIYMPTLYVSKRYGSRNKIFAGVDYTFYTSAYRFYRTNEIYPGEEKQHATEMTVFIGNEFLVGRFGLVLQAGYPFKSADLYKAKYVEKLGYNFYIIQNETGIIKELTIHSYIKANKFQAAAIEFGAGLAM